MSAAHDRPRVPRSSLALLALLACRRAPKRSALQTNQSYVEDVTRPTSLNVDDPMSVFGYVMSQLPERVKVYPTENYYYFGFFHNGIRYAGNIRLDASNRDDGKAIFAYFEDTSQWYDDAPVKHLRARCRAGRDDREGRAAGLSRDLSGQERRSSRSTTCAT